MPVRSLTVVCILLITGAAPLQADKIEFRNGERLIGTFVQAAGGTIVFQSEMMGELKIDRQRVSRLTVTAPATLHLRDGRVLTGTSFHLSDTGAIVSVTDGTTQKEVLARADIAAINPPTPPPVVWSGSMSVGFTSTHGSSFSENGSIDFSLSRRSRKHRVTLKGIYLYGREENHNADNGPDEKDEITTEENFTLKAKYDYFFTRKFFGYLSGSYKKDHIADLDYRIILGTGAGYQWFESARFTLSTGTGIALLKEKYTTRVYRETEEGEEEDDAVPRYVNEVERTDDLSWEFGGSTEWKIYDGITFLGNATWTPSIDDLSDYFLTADAELRTKMAKSLYSSFKVILDYDSTPGDDSGSTETKYILGIGWSF